MAERKTTLKIDSERIGEWMEFLKKTLPVADLDMYPLSLLEKFCEHAYMLEQNSSFCKNLPEEVFLYYVLFPRINNEDLSFNREIFYEALRDRIEGLSVQSAVIEINKWCHEQATYQQQDSRTASPLTVFRNASGRCGEESAFAVSALRSVGIPARQVYSPWWSHCDDNHAWVEVWCDGVWNFFGACEPEPILNKGWFNTAASRSMVVHSRLFGDGKVNEEIHGKAIGGKSGVRFLNQTARYANTQSYTFSVLQDGHPAVGTLLNVYVLNYSDYRSILEMRTDEKGEVNVELGIGDIYVSAEQNGLYAGGICKGGSQNKLSLNLQKYEFCEQQEKQFEIIAPISSDKNAVTLTQQQKNEREAMFENGNKLRNEKVANFFDEKLADKFVSEKDLLLESRGNFEEILKFLEIDGNPLRAQLLRILSHKDLRDVTVDVLEDHVQNVKVYNQEIPQDIFDKYVLCPRVFYEKLDAYRAGFLSIFDESDQEKYKKDPMLLWCTLQDEIEIVGDGEKTGLYWTPLQAYTAKRCNKNSLNILFVALLRTFGCPARLNPIDNIPEYWENQFVPVYEKETGCVIFENVEKKPLLYSQNWSVSQFLDGVFLPIVLEDGNWQNEQCKAILPVGEYRLITSSRLPSGNQFVIEKSFAVCAEKTHNVKVELRSFAIEDMLTSQKISAFETYTQAGELVESPGVHIGENSVLLFLEEGAEPTEHILNEFIELAEKEEDFPAEIYVFLRSEKALKQETFAKFLKIWQRSHLYFGEWHYNVEQLARQFYVDPDSPPLALVCDGNGHVVYATSGYNVGAVELMAQISYYLKDEKSL